jgi:hypothetical protein
MTFELFMRLFLFSNFPLKKRINISEKWFECLTVDPIKDPASHRMWNPAHRMYKSQPRMWNISMNNNTCVVLLFKWSACERDNNNNNSVSNWCLQLFRYYFLGNFRHVCKLSRWKCWFRSRWHRLSQFLYFFYYFYYYFDSSTRMSPPVTLRINRWRVRRCAWFKEIISRRS